MRRTTTTAALWLLLLFAGFATTATAQESSVVDPDEAAAATTTTDDEGDEQDAPPPPTFQLFPRRTVQEAAVLEWGSSAIITALDASVAWFGPQTSDAALLEVETQPVIAQPLDGLRKETKQLYQDYLKQQQKEKKEPEQEETQPNDTDTDSDTDARTTEDGNEEGAEQDPSSDDLGGDTNSTAPIIFEVPIQPLDNADDIVGNLCIMTTHAGVSGVELALMAQASGAAALLVVNVADGHRPDDIYRLPIPENDEERAASIDIPVVMISLNSAQMLATALLDPELPNARELARQAGFSTKYMPHRVRLYAGDDRPFFEDVQAVSPTIYLIHDLLKEAECDRLIQQANTAGLERLSNSDNPRKQDILQYTAAPDRFVNVDRVTLWQGLLMTHAAKQVEERMEQVTSFPAAHYSDFVVDRLARNGTSMIHPHYDMFYLDVEEEDAYTTPGLDQRAIPVASMTIFLSDAMGGGGEIVYPSVSDGEKSKTTTSNNNKKKNALPIHIQPRKGMAVIHHNTDERGQVDASAMRGLLPLIAGSDDDNDDDEYFYVAHKYIFMEPVPTARRVVLPALAAPTRGRLPNWIIQVHDLLLQQFGQEQGSTYFDKLCIGGPVLILALLVQFIVDRVRKELNKGSAAAATTSNEKQESSASKSKSKKRAKRD